MPSPIETLLTSAGIPAEDVASITTLSEDDQKTFDPAPYLDKVKNNYQTQFQNDPAFFEGITIEKLPPEVSKKIEATQFARASNIMKGKVLKTLGMTEADLGDLTEEQREKLEPYLGAIVEKWAKTKSGDPQVQQELIEARKRLESFDGYEEKIKSQYETASEQKITDIIKNAALISELSSIPGLKINASDIVKTASDILTSKHDFERVGDFTVELRQKGKPGMKVLKPGTSHEVTLKDALLEIATERGWVDKEKEGGTGSGKIKVEPNGKGGLDMVPPHLKGKIESKIAQEA